MIALLFVLVADVALNEPPAGFVDLKEAVPGIALEIRYHTKDNFTGEQLPGYSAAGAWLLKEPAEALARVQAALAKEGLGLLVYDAYRPLRGTLGMVAWAERTNQVFLLDNGYIARRSGHNHGHTIDLTVIDLKTKKPLDMGTPWDTLTEESHTMKAKGKALQNRLKLKTAMEAQGFKAYFKEWWHFGYPMKGTRSRNVPYGKSESPEK
jgi:D-alanyl-D-alanine dipeptidase